jgi:hypothetical protein
VNTRKQAIELASAHLRDEGSALVVRQNGLRRDNVSPGVPHTIE